MAAAYYLAIAVIPLLSLIDILSCSGDINHDLSVRKEVEDFAEFLRLKTEKETGSDRNSHLEQLLEDSEYTSHERDTSAEREPSSLNSENFRSLMEEKFQSVPHSDEQPPEQNIYSRQSLDNQQVPSALLADDHHHPVEEILYIRRSDSESNDPVAGVLDKLVHGDPGIDATTLTNGSDDNPTSLVEDEPYSDDSCISQTLLSHLHQTCSEGPEYEMQFHPTFSETLRHDMEKMLPEKDPDDNKCDYGKILTTKAGVEDRALCPFEWQISNRNPFRIPEYQYEAKCSCQLSRKIRGERFQCREVKRTIPVLWIVGCGPHTKRKYRQGWEEVAVACAPLEEKDSNIVSNMGGPR